MFTYLMIKLYLVTAAAPGEGFFRGPDFASIQFLKEPYQWLIGVILAVVILVAGAKGAILLLSLPGADTHKAKNVGAGLGFCVVAVALAWMFAPLFTSLFSSLAA